MEKNQNNKSNSFSINNILTENLVTDINTEEMTVKIQTLDNIFPIVIKKTATLNELKEKIFEVI